MGKNDRFPSPANVKVDKDGKPVPAAVKAKQDPAGKDVEGAAVQVVEVENKTVRNIGLTLSVHLAPGLNCVNSAVWAEAKDAPSIAALIKAGQIVVDGQAPVQPKAKADEDSDEKE